MGHSTLDEASKSIVSPYVANQSTELARIFAEISERMIEAIECDPDHAYCWIRRLAAVLSRQEGPATLYWYFMLQTGDYAALTESLSAIGKRSARSKQAVQQELERATDDLVRIFPAMASAIHELRRSVKKYV
jgi:hypothetical protein